MNKKDYNCMINLIDHEMINWLLKNQKEIKPKNSKNIHYNES